MGQHPRLEVLQRAIDLAVANNLPEEDRWLQLARKLIEEYPPKNLGVEASEVLANVHEALRVTQKSVFPILPKTVGKVVDVMTQAIAEAGKGLIHEYKFYRNCSKERRRKKVSYTPS